ncbi:hypothetical protein [Saccharospirillum impatiens]|uniref:hypothetical protein n=1 Tax=Saccharospirillum impatiens TaxID=169438 RepID=UPI0004223652|nr:hypothetical protein [Saccharospirillum impatiens]
MTTLFSHFLAQVLGCASLDNVHNVVRHRLMFSPDHGFSRAEVDDFILNGSSDVTAVARWADLLKLDVTLLTDAARVAARAKPVQQRALPHLEVNWIGRAAITHPEQRIEVQARVAAEGIEDRPYLTRKTGYTLADLNREGGFEQVLSFASSHWHDVEQLSGQSASVVSLSFESI